jgi:hypothetical protein
MFKLMKVFDCQEMPDDVREAFFSNTEGMYSNDCYINYWIAECPEIDYEDNDPHKVVDMWLKQFPLSPSEASGEEPVIIKHWW